MTILQIVNICEEYDPGGRQATSRCHKKIGPEPQEL